MRRRADLDDAGDDGVAPVATPPAFRPFTRQDRRSPPEAPGAIATIFTAQDRPRYEALKARHEKEPGICRMDNHVCIDEQTRYGIWTPYSWVVER